jgi:VCBS repeat protein/PQQ enzyme-like repeat protein
MYLDKRAACCVRRVRGLSTAHILKALFSISFLVAAGLWSTIVPTNAQVNVTQFHNHANRDGLYVDAAFTQAAAAGLVRDTAFSGTIVGNVYAQPLYIEGGSGPRLIVVTESNNVYALNATTGAIIWQRNVGTPVPQNNLFCDTFGSMGIIGTPIVDLSSRALFLNTLVTPDGGTTKKHYILSLNVDTGATNAGWPVDVGLTATYNGLNFLPDIQMQRPALGIAGGIVHVGYGSFGDCSNYHGWLVGVPINNPAGVRAWAAGVTGGGGAIWSTSGIVSDGVNVFAGTGNTFNPATWSGGEAVIRFQPGPIFSGNTADYWAPTNWQQLDAGDNDLGASGPILVDVQGATPSRLVVAMGKDGNAYLLNRDNLGGITAPIASAQESFSYIFGAPATYRTAQGTYVAFRASSSVPRTFRITATNPPTITNGWSASQNGCGSPFVTTTDGTNNAIVWFVGTQGDQRLHGYNGDTGAVVYGGGGANELMAGTHSYSTTGIVARGHIYVATDNKVYSFKLPGGTPTPTPTPTATPTPTPPPPTPTPTATTTPTPIAVTADFNGDGHPDWVIRHAATGQTAIVYLNNNLVIDFAFGPPIPNGWSLACAADFNGDGHPDYALFIPRTGQTVIGYLSGPTPTVIGAALGPTLPSGWALVATADFNGDGHPDWVIRHAATGQTAILYMNNKDVIDFAFGPPIPNGWSLAGVADFDGDGHPDYALFIPRTGQTVIGYLSGPTPTVIGVALGPTLPSGWALVATNDFNGDGKPDHVLYRASTGQTAILYLNNNIAIDAKFGPTLPAGWTLAAP